MQTINSFSDILAPITPETFYREHYHKRWMHVPGTPEKFGSVMSWEILNRLLSMAVWDPQSFRLMMDKRAVPAGAYCENAPDRHNQQRLQPSPDKVMALLRQGASLLLNQIETLHPGVCSAVGAIEREFAGISLANVYCTWEGRQGFDSHFDKHDVFALQIDGEKTWRFYEGGAQNPVRHPVFQAMPQEEIDRLKGRMVGQVVARPGDLIYVPRGQTHDAIASSAASIHVTISCMEPVGLDWLTFMWERAVYDPLFRASLPRPAEGEAALAAHLEKLADRLRALALSPQALQDARGMRAAFGRTAEPYAIDLSSGPDRSEERPARREPG